MDAVGGVPIFLRDATNERLHIFQSHTNAHTGTTKGTRCLKEVHEVGMNRGRGFGEDIGGEGNGVEYDQNIYLHV